MDPELLNALRALVLNRVTLAQTPEGFAALRDLLAAHDHWQAMAGKHATHADHWQALAEGYLERAHAAEAEVLAILGVALAQVWRAAYGEPSFASVSVEPVEGVDGPGFVARATVGGIKLGEVGQVRSVAMARLIAAARVRGEIERRIADEAEVRRCSGIALQGQGSIEPVTIQGTVYPWGNAPNPHVSETEDTLAEVEGLGPSLTAGAQAHRRAWAEARGINATEVADGEGES